MADDDVKNETNFGIAGNPGQTLTPPTPTPPQMVSTFGGGGISPPGTPPPTGISPSLQALIDKAAGISMSPGRKGQLLATLAHTVAGVESADRANLSHIASANITTQPHLINAEAMNKPLPALNFGLGSATGQTQTAQNNTQKTLAQIFAEKFPSSVSSAITGNAAVAPSVTNSPVSSPLRITQGLGGTTISNADNYYNNDNNSLGPKYRKPDFDVQ